MLKENVLSPYSMDAVRPSAAEEECVIIIFYRCSQTIRQTVATPVMLETGRELQSSNHTEQLDLGTWVLYW